MKKATQGKITIKLEEINQKVLAKEGRLNKYRQRVNNTDKTGLSKTAKENSTNKWDEMSRKHINNQMQGKLKDLGRKYGNQKHNERTKWKNNMKKIIRRARRKPKSGNTHRFTQKGTKTNTKLENSWP